MRYFKSFILLGTLIFSNDILAQLYHGELQVLVLDNFKHNTSQTIYQLHEANDVYLLDLPKEINKKKLLSGVHVSIEGREKKNFKEEKTIEVKSLVIKDSSFLEPSMLDERRAVALMINFQNLKASSTVNADILTNILYTSPRSMQKNFALSSFNQVNFLHDSDNKNTDIYTVELDYNVQDCNYNKWANDATNEAIANGINLTPYRHIILVLPQSVNCSWGGAGNLGCGNVCYTWVRAYKPSNVYSQLIYTHELGHNLGMGHASTDLTNDGQVDSEYGDAACIMGTGDFQYFKEVNAPHRDQMHWFASFPNQIKTIITEGEYTLYPLEEGTNSNGLLSLKVKKNESDYYYISYRKNIGPFGPGAPNYLDKVSIHRANPDGSQTFFIKTLDANASFVDEENKINIKVLSLDKEKAIVHISLSPYQERLSSFRFFENDNSQQVGYSDWDPNYWKGNCPAHSETVGLSADITTHRPNSIACLIKDSSTTTASGEFSSSLGGVDADARSFSRSNDWDPSFYKWECGLNEYISGFSQNIITNQLHKIRCAKGEFTNGGQNLCETRYVSNGMDDRGSNTGNDWDPNYYKAQCSDGKLIFGISIDVLTRMPHKILCCDK